MGQGASGSPGAVVDYGRPAGRTDGEVTHSLVLSGADTQTGRPPTNPTGQEPADG